MTPEQQKVLAIARARRRRSEADQQSELAIKGDRVPGNSKTFEGRDGEGIFEKIDAGVRGVADALTFGLSDEITAGLGTGFGFLGDYDKELARQRGIDDFDSEHNNIARLSGQVAGSVAGAGGLAKRGLTLMSKEAMKAGGKEALKRATAEGAAYGAAYGAGSADEDDRLIGFLKGGATGAAAGAALQKVGNVMASKKAAKAASDAMPTTDDLAAQASQLYEGMRQSGMTIKPGPLNHMRGNISITLGQSTPELAPEAHRLARLVDDRFSDGVNIVDLHNLSKTVNRKLREVAKGGEDAHFIGKIKTFVDNTIEGLKPGDVTGADPAKVVAMKKQADALWGQVKKSEIIEKIADSADIRSGQYTQSGLANAVRTEMRGLAKQIRNGKVKGFSPEEVALIKQIARGGSASHIVNLMAKFSPRGFFPIMAGAGGMAFNPAVGVGMMMGGHVAGKAADKSAARALDALRASALTGKAPVIAGNVGTAATRPFVPAIALQAEQARNQMLSPQPMQLLPQR